VGRCKIDRRVRRIDADRSIRRVLQAHRPGMRQIQIENARQHGA
jgi:hypothetical protein